MRSTNQINLNQTNVTSLYCADISAIVITSNKGIALSLLLLLYKLINLNCNSNTWIFIKWTMKQGNNNVGVQQITSYHIIKLEDLGQDLAGSGLSILGWVGYNCGYIGPGAAKLDRGQNRFNMRQWIQSGCCIILCSF